MNSDNQWHEVTGYEGLYSVNQFGDVFSHRLGRTIAPNDDGRGYLTVQCRKNGRRILAHKRNFNHYGEAA